GAPHVADLDRAREHLVQGLRRHPREQRASRVRAHERRERSQEGGEQPGEHPERDPERAADHQKAWPTANWTTIRRQKPPGSAGRTIFWFPLESVTAVRLPVVSFSR